MGEAWKNLGVALRWYVAARLLQWALKLMMREINEEEAHAFNMLADSMLNDRRFDI